MALPLNCTAFAGSTCIATGRLPDIALAVKDAFARDPAAKVIVFDDETGEQVELDLRGSADDVAERYREQPRTAGRPKLGVVPREVTLLPRHWEWLGAQPGGASVALRRLVDEARWVHSGRDRVRRSQDTAYRFMSTIAGNEPGFEEAARALYARDAGRFGEHTASWPGDVREHAQRLATDALSLHEAAVAQSPAGEQYR
jgi:hypothetical protein